MLDRTRVDVRLTWWNTDESLRVSAFVDTLFNANNLRGIGTGDHNNFYRLTVSLQYPRYWGIDVQRTFDSETEWRQSHGTKVPRIALVPVDAINEARVAFRRSRRSVSSHATITGSGSRAG